MENNVVAIRRRTNLHVVATVEPCNALYQGRDLRLQFGICSPFARVGDNWHGPRLDVCAHGTDVR